jgi:hypothetical protein
LTLRVAGVARVDGVGDRGTNLRGDVVALVGRYPPDDLVHIALGQRAHRGLL